MNLLFIFLPLFIFILVLAIFIYFKKLKPKKNFNLFKGEGGVYFQENSFLKGILQGLISGNEKNKQFGNLEGVGFGGRKKDKSKEGVKYSFTEEKAFKEKAEEKEGRVEGVENIDGEIKDLKVSEGEIKESRKRLEQEIKLENKGNRANKIQKKIGKKKESSQISKKEDRGGVKQIIKIDMDKVLNNLKNTDFGLILNSLKKEEYSFIIDKLDKLKFSSREDFLKSLSEEFVNLLREANKELEYRLSKIRKGGKNVNELNLKLMSAPLKIKVFEATLSKKDFDKVLNIMRVVDKELVPYEEKNSK